MLGLVSVRRSRHRFLFFFSSRRRHTRFKCDWSSDVCSSDLNQRWKKSSHAEESQLQRHHHRVLEFLRRYLQTWPLDALGHAQLRKRPADANHGHGPWCVAGALPQRAHRDGLFQPMKPAAKSKKSATAGSANSPELLPAHELRRLIDSVLRF